MLIAVGDPSKLATILAIFLDEILPEHADRTFEYEVYVELIGAPVKMWRPARARIVSEDTLEIIRLPVFRLEDVRLEVTDNLVPDVSHVFSYRTNVQTGDHIKVTLTDTLHEGVTLIAKE